MNSALSSSAPPPPREIPDSSRNVVRPVQRAALNRVQPALEHAGKAFVAGVAGTGSLIAGGIALDVIIVSAAAGLSIACVAGLALALVFGLRRYLQSGVQADRLNAEIQATELETDILTANSDARLRKLTQTIGESGDVFSAANMRQKQAHLLILANSRRATLWEQRGRLLGIPSREVSVPVMLTGLEKARSDVKTCWYFNKGYYNDLWLVEVSNVVHALSRLESSDANVREGIACLKLWRSQDSQNSVLTESVEQLILHAYTVLFRSKESSAPGAARGPVFVHDGSDSDDNIDFP